MCAVPLVSEGDWRYASVQYVIALHRCFGYFLKPPCLATFPENSSCWRQFSLRILRGMHAHHDPISTGSHKLPILYQQGSGVGTIRLLQRNSTGSMQGTSTSLPAYNTVKGYSNELSASTTGALRQLTTKHLSLGCRASYIMPPRANRIASLHMTEKLASETMRKVYSFKPA